MTTVAQTAALAALRKTAAKHKQQQMKVTELETKLYQQIVEAHKAGVPKLTLSQAAGVSRGTIYTVLLRAEVGGEG